jgi:environmental stress-induced protein Ves
MARIERFTAADYRRVAWRNGRGTTLEVLREPVGEGPDFAWRISLADVETDGPFSAFAGCERWITVVAGEGMILRHGEGLRPAVVPRLRPYRFSGDLPTECELIAGPVRDFNLIVRRDAARGAVAVLHADRATVVPAVDGILVLHLLEGACELAVDGAQLTVGSGETVRIDGAEGAVTLRPRLRLVALKAELRDPIARS